MGVKIIDNEFAFDPQNIHEIGFVMKQHNTIWPHFL